MGRFLCFLMCAGLLACSERGETDYSVETLYSGDRCEIRQRFAFANGDIGGATPRRYFEARCHDDSDWVPIVRYEQGRFELVSYDENSGHMEYRYCGISPDARYAHMSPDFSYLEQSGISAELTEDNADFCDDWLLHYCAGPNHASNWGRTVCINREPRPGFVPDWRTPMENERR